MAPIDERKAWRETISRSVRHGHSAAEESDPPPSADHSFRAGIAHFSGAAERMSKRVTVLVAMASAAGIVGSAGFAYWTAKQDFAKQSSIVEINASVRRIEAAVESQKLTVQNDREQLHLINDELFDHTQQLAGLTAPRAARRPKTGSPLP